MNGNVKNPRHTWTALGKTQASIQSKEPPKDPILIYEEPCSFRMDGTEDVPYGIAISTKSAVCLMAALLKDFEKAGISLVGLPLVEDDNAGTETEKNERRKKLLLLLVASFGITFDKSILLKILSQPLCEGIRFYPCKKNVPDDTGEKKPFFSLVLVGVDKDGHDLHFEGSTLDDIKSGPPDISRSLTSEYGHPPTQADFIKSEKFKLLRLAEIEAESL